MILAFLVSALVGCDTGLTALFTPPRPVLGSYEVCALAEPLDQVVKQSSADAWHFAASEMLEPLEAFGAAGGFDRAALARLYGGKRVRVARGWLERPEGFQSVTLLSPYPDPTLTHLEPGTMMIRWNLPARARLRASGFGGLSTGHPRPRGSRP